MGISVLTDPKINTNVDQKIMTKKNIQRFHKDTALGDHTFLEKM